MESKALALGAALAKAEALDSNLFVTLFNPFLNHAFIGLRHK